MFAFSTKYWHELCRSHVILFFLWSSDHRRVFSISRLAEGHSRELNAPKLDVKKAKETIALLFFLNIYEFISFIHIFWFWTAKLCSGFKSCQVLYHSCGICSNLPWNAFEQGFVNNSFSVVRCRLWQLKLSQNGFKAWVWFNLNVLLPIRAFSSHYIKFHSSLSK